MVTDFIFFSFLFLIQNNKMSSELDVDVAESIDRDKSDKEEEQDDYFDIVEKLEPFLVGTLDNANVLRTFVVEETCTIPSIQPNEMAVIMCEKRKLIKMIESHACLSQVYLYYNCHEFCVLELKSHDYHQNGLSVFLMMIEDECIEIILVKLGKKVCKFSLNSFAKIDTFLSCIVFPGCSQVK